VYVCGACVVVVIQRERERERDTHIDTERTPVPVVRKEPLIEKGSIFSTISFLFVFWVSEDACAPFASAHTLPVTHTEFVSHTGSFCVLCMCVLCMRVL